MIAKPYTKKNGEVMVYINDNGTSQGLSSNDLSLARNKEGGYKFVNWDLIEAFDNAVLQSGFDADGNDFKKVGTLKLFGFVGKKGDEFFAVKTIGDALKAVKLPFQF